MPSKLDIATASPLDMMLYEGRLCLGVKDARHNLCAYIGHSGRWKAMTENK
jgi:hypothetical protein